MQEIEEAYMMSQMNSRRPLPAAMSQDKSMYNDKPRSMD